MENTPAGIPAQDSKSGMIAVSVGLLIVGLVAGYAIGKSGESDVEVSDWQTYTNTVYHVSVQLPPGWKIEDRRWITAFYSPEAQEYNRGVTCEEGPAESENCTPHSLRIDISLSEFYMPVGSSPSECEAVTISTKLFYYCPEQKDDGKEGKIFYAYQVSRDPQDDRYYAFTFYNQTQDFIDRVLGSLVVTLPTSPSPAISKAPTPVSTPNTSTMLLFTHPQGVYTIKYPSDWFTDTIEGPVGSHTNPAIATVYIRNGSQLRTKTSATATIELSAVANPKNLSGEQEWNERRKTAQDPDNSLSRGNVQLAGQTAFKLTYANSNYYLLPYQGLMYEITVSWQTGSEQTKLNQMLSTFKFTNSR